jgi:hypothetical protein
MEKNNQLFVESTILMAGDPHLEEAPVTSEGTR